MDIHELARQNQQSAWKVLEDTCIIEAWERIGATVHLVGSLRTGLLAKSRDIDIHIYTDRLDVGESFSVIRELAERLPLQEIQYRNLIHTEEECMEWHALYKDREQNTWKFDMIHIRKGSRYDGVVEKVTAAIAERLTPEIRKTILQIKFDVPDGVTIPGIEIYHAVFTGVSALIRSLKSGAKQISWRTVSVGFRNLRGRYQDFLLYGWLPLYCWHLTCLGCFSGDCSQYRCSLPAGERFPCLENLVG